MKTMFPSKISYYNKPMRQYFSAPGIYVSEDGRTVIRYYESDLGSSIMPKRPPKRLTVRVDTNGRSYVSTRDYGRLMVEILVATCFCPPCPTPKNNYELVHRDGNLQNCHYKNLEWRKKQPMPQVTIHTTAKSVKLANGLTVHQDGSIYDGKEKLIREISLYDSDTDLFWSIQPRITYYRENKWKRDDRKRATIDSLMAEAGYVAGERSQYKDPVILHKDMDWLNVDSSNLEWCDASDQRYKDYIKKQKEDMNEWNKANNKDFPDSFLN